MTSLQLKLDIIYSRAGVTPHIQFTFLSNIQEQIIHFLVPCPLLANVFGSVLWWVLVNCNGLRTNVSVSGKQQKVFFVFCVH